MTRHFSRRRFVQAATASAAALAAATALSTRACARHAAAPAARAATYVDHDGWMLTADESRKLRASRLPE